MAFLSNGTITSVKVLQISGIYHKYATKYQGQYYRTPLVTYSTKFFFISVIVSIWFCFNCLKLEYFYTFKRTIFDLIWPTNIKINSIFLCFQTSAVHLMPNGSIAVLLELQRLPAGRWGAAIMRRKGCASGPFRAIDHRIPPRTVDGAAFLPTSALV